MDKIKGFMRSLRARLSTLKSRGSDKPTKSRESSFLSSCAQHSIDSGSGFALRTQVTSFSELQITATTSSVPIEPVCSDAMALDRALNDCVLIEDQSNRYMIDLDAHASLEVNVAMLSFAKRLPLELLDMIGRGLTFCSSSKNNDTAEVFKEVVVRSVMLDLPAKSIIESIPRATSNSSRSFACCSARRVEGDYGDPRCLKNGNLIDMQLSRKSLEMSEGSPIHSRTLSLTSKETDSTSSFAGCSARQTDEDYTQWELVEGTNSFGRFGESTCGDEFMRSHSRQESIDASVGYLYPDTQYSSIAPANHSFIWPIVRPERSPSFSKRSVDSCDLFLESIGLPIPMDEYRATNNEVFDDLPNWSDVEDDPDYNTFSTILYND